MAEIAYLENPKRKKRRKKRNPSATKIRPATKAVGLKRRNGVSLVQAKNALKKNGLKAVSSKMANPKRKRRKRRNGVSVMPRKQNGFFANSKTDLKNTGVLVGGAFATVGLSRLVNSVLGRYATQVGVGQYSQLISSGLVALVIVPYVAEKIGGKAIAGTARSGGLLALVLEGVNQFFPQLSQYNPFITSQAVVMQSGQPLLTPQATSAVVAATDASPQAKAKVAMAMQMLQAQSAPTHAPTYSSPSFAGIPSNYNQDDDWSSDGGWN